MHPQLPVVMVSAREEPAVVRRALDHGAMGFIPKSSDAATLAGALRQVLDGERWAPEAALDAAPIPDEERAIAARVRELTPQQFRVLQTLGAGLLNKQIGYELGVSEATIKAHMSAVLRKLGATNRTQAILLAGKLAVGAGRGGAAGGGRPPVNFDSEHEPRGRDHGASHGWARATRPPHWLAVKTGPWWGRSRRRVRAWIVQKS